MIVSSLPIQFKGSGRPSGGISPGEGLQEAVQGGLECPRNTWVQHSVLWTACLISNFQLKSRFFTPKIPNALKFACEIPCAQSRSGEELEPEPSWLLKEGSADKTHFSRATIIVGVFFVPIPGRKSLLGNKLENEFILLVREKGAGKKAGGTCRCRWV